jgi:hypothetical protein
MLRRLALLGAMAAIINLVPLGPAHAACDPVTLHGSGCTQSIRCLPANAGLDCI